MQSLSVATHAIIAVRGIRTFCAISRHTRRQIKGPTMYAHGRHVVQSPFEKTIYCGMSKPSTVDSQLKLSHQRLCSYSPRRDLVLRHHSPSFKSLLDRRTTHMGFPKAPKLSRTNQMRTTTTSKPAHLQSS